MATASLNTDFMTQKTDSKKQSVAQHKYTVLRKVLPRKMKQIREIVFRNFMY